MMGVREEVAQVAACKSEESEARGRRHVEVQRRIQLQMKVQKVERRTQMHHVKRTKKFVAYKKG